MNYYTISHMEFSGRNKYFCIVANFFIFILEINKIKKFIFKMEKNIRGI